MEKKNSLVKRKLKIFFKKGRKSSHFDASANIEIFKMIAHFEWRNERKSFFIGMKLLLYVYLFIFRMCTFEIKFIFYEITLGSIICSGSGNVRNFRCYSFLSDCYYKEILRLNLEVYEDNKIF